MGVLYANKCRLQQENVLRPACEVPDNYTQFYPNPDYQQISINVPTIKHHGNPYSVNCAGYIRTDGRTDEVHVTAHGRFSRLCQRT